MHGKTKFLEPVNLKLGVLFFFSFSIPNYKFHKRVYLCLQHISEVRFELCQYNQIILNQNVFFFFFFSKLSEQKFS